MMIIFQVFLFSSSHGILKFKPAAREINGPIRQSQCCTQFKSPGVKILCGIHIEMTLKFLKQNILFPKSLNWVQH